MDIEIRLKSKNPTLISHAISKLVEAVEKKCKGPEDLKQIFNSTEVQTIFAKCTSDDILVCSTACQAIVALVEGGVLAIAQTLRHIISLIGSAKYFTPITSAMSNLLMLEVLDKLKDKKYHCPFKLDAPQHPFITILNEKPDIWNNVLIQMQELLHGYIQPDRINKELNSQQRVLCTMELLRPVFLYVLCNPASTIDQSCKRQLWHMLLKFKVGRSYQLEIIQWLRHNNPVVCVDTSNRLLQLSEEAIANEDREICTFLTPILVSNAMQLADYGCDPKLNIQSLLSMSSENESSSLALFLIAEMITSSSIVHLPDLINASVNLLHHSKCSMTSAYSLVSSLLQWMAYPSLISKSVFDAAQDLIDFIVKKNDWSDNNSEQLIKNQCFLATYFVDSKVQFYSEVCRALDKLTETTIAAWLKNLQEAPSDIIYQSRIILGGLLIQFNSEEISETALSVLIKMAKSNPECASYVLTLILYKLTKSQDFEEIKCLVTKIPELAGSVENTPLVIKTLETFAKAGGEPLRNLALQLYLTVLKNNSRCHRYVITALIESSQKNNSRHSSLARAKTMQHICEAYPEYGAELVPLLSKALSRDKGSENSIASALALKGISSLCHAGVIDVNSTWKAMSPILHKEDRPVVQVALCEFFVDISAFIISENKSEIHNLLDNVVTKLWDYVVSPNSAKQVIEAALSALSHYNLEYIRLSHLPSKFKENLKLPANKPDDSAEKAEQAMNHVPGYCWIQALRSVRRSELSLVGNLLKSYIYEETSEYRSGIYALARGEPQSYSQLLDKSVVKAIGNFVVSHKDKEDEAIAIECLRILAQKYPKPLPPINWNFLQKFKDMSDVVDDYCLAILCRQSIVSPSARKCIEKYLNDLAESKTFDCKSYTTLYSNLEYLCSANITKDLKLFLEVSLDCVLDKIPNESALEMFKLIMKMYTETLNDYSIHDSNRTLLSVNMEKLFEKFKSDSQLFTLYVPATMELSLEHIKRMTSPSVWWETTEENIRKAIVIRTQLALKRDVEQPLVWMNEIIEAAAPVPSVHQNVLENILSIQSQMRQEKFTPKWILDLMGQIQMTLKKEDDGLDTALFYCEILFVSLIALAGVNHICDRKESLIDGSETNKSLFSEAVSIISAKPMWKEITPQIMEWLNRMRVALVPLSYRNAFHAALVKLKHQQHFSIAWTKYLSNKVQVDL